MAAGWLTQTHIQLASLKSPGLPAQRVAFSMHAGMGPPTSSSSAQPLTDTPSDQPDKDNYIQLRLFSGDPRLCRVDDRYTEMLHPSITVKHTSSKCKITMHIFAPLNAAFLDFTYA